MSAHHHKKKWDRDTAHTLYGQGVSVPDIAKAVGISPIAFRSYIRRHPQLWPPREQPEGLRKARLEGASPKPARARALRPGATTLPALASLQDDSEPDLKSD